jgi:cytochrome c peroxidase
MCGPFRPSYQLATVTDARPISPRSPERGRLIAILAAADTLHAEVMDHAHALPYKGRMHGRHAVCSLRAVRVTSCSVAALLLAGVWINDAAGQAHDARRLRLGLPPVPVPESNPQSPAKVALGKRLFFDPRLSGDGRISCASCHQPDRAFTDGRPLAQGIDAQLGTRNAPTLLNVAYNATQFWDGRRPSLELQALDPLVNPLEHGLRNEAELLSRIRESPTYLAQFQAAFPEDRSAVTAAHVAEALASFERTLIAADSPFDQFFYGHRPSALSASALRGFDLFRGAGRCSSCHTIERRYALFTDNSYHSANVGLQRISATLASLTTRLVAARRRGASVDQMIISDRGIAELGRFVVTLDPADIGKFRTPSLRNVALTAPYMHDGSVATLNEAVERELYDHTQPGRPLILTPQEKRDLVAFLQALTSPDISQVHARIE